MIELAAAMIDRVGVMVGDAFASQVVKRALDRSRDDLWTPVMVFVSKRFASTLTEYSPGLSCGKLNRPESSVCTDRFSPLSMFVAVTVAPGTAASAGSVTDPAIALVVSPCAITGTLQMKKRTIPANLGMPK